MRVEIPVMGTIRTLIRNRPWLRRAVFLWKWRLCRCAVALLGDVAFIRRQYKKRTGKPLAYENPKTFSEKMQWLKIHWRDSRCTQCADKYLVRDYVAQRVGTHVLTSLYGVYTSVTEVRLDELPAAFVLKTTHGSGQNLICRDKRAVQWAECFKDLDLSMRCNFYYLGCEWVYKNIVPRLICEEYMEEDGQPPADYKFFCFNGVPRIVQVDVDRFSNHTRNMYDMDWNLLDFGLIYPKSLREIPRPARFSRMAEIAQRLSEGFPFVRVDLYNLPGRIVFGEMTFYPENGMERFKPEAYDRVFGDWLSLPLSARDCRLSKEEEADTGRVSCASNDRGNGVVSND